MYAFSNLCWMINYVVWKCTPTNISICLNSVVFSTILNLKYDWIKYSVFIQVVFFFQWFCSLFAKLFRAIGESYTIWWGIWDCQIPLKTFWFGRIVKFCIQLYTAEVKCWNVKTCSLWKERRWLIWRRSGSTGPTCWCWWHCQQQIQRGVQRQWWGVHGWKDAHKDNGEDNNKP